jgi:hypothetical protein
VDDAGCEVAGERDVGEPGGDLADPGDVAAEVRAAWHLRGHILLAHRRGSRAERGRAWQLGVD